LRTRRRAAAEEGISGAGENHNHGDSPHHALQEVMGPGNDELKGELAKIVLVEFASLDETSEYVRSAVRAAREPDMIVPLLIIGAVLIVLAVLPTKVKTKNFTVEFGNLQSVAELTKGLSDIMGKLKPGG
jgi:hypothetical protein